MKLVDVNELALQQPRRDDDVEAPEHLIKQSRAAWYFATMAGDQVRYDHGRRRWLVWTSHRWQPDEDGSIEQLWLGILGERFLFALAASDRQRQAKLNDVQTAGATNAAMAGGLEIAASMPPIATRATAWDPDPYLLCCNNGVVDLRTGELRDGRPEDMISRSTRVDFDPEARCPRWDRFLLEIFAGDQELVDWFALLTGMSLVGESKEVLPVLHGRGNNGKSVTIKSLRAAFGEYVVIIPIETLTNSKREAGQATPDLIRLWGARIAFATEPDKAARLQGGTLKRLVNIDQMTGRPLYGEQVSWDPTHSLFLSTNHLPTTDDTTDSFWRRIALVPFNVHFAKPGEDGPPEDADLAATLAGEAPGILAWAIRGAVAAAADPRAVKRFPTAVQVKTAAYRAEQDPLSAFVDDMIVFDPKARITLKDLYAAYSSWCDEQSDVERLGNRAFKTAFEDRDQRVTFQRKLGRREGYSTHGCSVRDVQRPFPKLSRELEELESPGNPPRTSRVLQFEHESLLEPATKASEWNVVLCSDYTHHQTHHRRVDGGWICDLCSSPVPNPQGDDHD